VAFQVADNKALARALRFSHIYEPVFAVIWTTTPWTLPANQAVAVHPDFEYVLVRFAAGNIHLAKELADKCMDAYGIDDRQIVASAYQHAARHVQRLVRWCSRSRDAGAGTGLVHTAPAHALDDMFVGSRYRLPVDTRWTTTASSFQGALWSADCRVGKANDVVIKALEHKRRLIANRIGQAQRIRTAGARFGDRQSVGIHALVCQLLGKNEYSRGEAHQHVFEIGMDGHRLIGRTASTAWWSRSRQTPAVDMREAQAPAPGLVVSDLERHVDRRGGAVLVFPPLPQRARSGQSMHSAPALRPGIRSRLADAAERPRMMSASFLKSMCGMGSASRRARPTIEAPLLALDCSPRTRASLRNCAAGMFLPWQPFDLVLDRRPWQSQPGT